MNYPTLGTLPNYPVEPKDEDNSIATEYEDGSVQSRVKFTRSRKIFKLQYDVLPETDYNILHNFIVNVAKFKANIFTWHNPFDGNNYEVRFGEQSFVNFADKYYRGSIELKEA